MKSKYNLFKEGEYITPEKKAHNLACCDCGLIHTIKYRIKAIEIRENQSVSSHKEAKKTLEELVIKLRKLGFELVPQFNLYTNNRATGQRRRHLNIQTTNFAKNYRCVLWNKNNKIVLEEGKTLIINLDRVHEILLED